VPIRNGEAYYVEVLGPDRSRSGGGQDMLEGIRQALRGNETIDDLDRYLTDLAEWVEERWSKAKIGNKHGEIQTVVDWMNLSARLLDIRNLGKKKLYYVSRPKTIKPILTGQETVEDCRRLTAETCEVLERWYKNEHGTFMEHQWFVNTMTLVLRLLEGLHRVDTTSFVRDDTRRVRKIPRQPAGDR